MASVLFSAPVKETASFASSLVIFTVVNLPTIISPSIGKSGIPKLARIYTISYLGVKQKGKEEHSLS